MRLLPGLLLLAACAARERAPRPDAAVATAAPVAEPPADGAPASAPACIVRRARPYDEATHAAIVDITVLLDRCRVVPVIADRLTTLDTLAPQGALFGVNGGFYDLDGRPLGLRRIDGVERSRPWNKPLGGVLALAGTSAYVGPRAQMPDASEAAVQCKPLLVEHDGENGIHSDDGRRAARTTACTTRDGALHFVLFLAGPGDGPTLTETADLLRTPVAQGGFGCSAALNLDGGPSTGLWLPAGESTLPRGPIVDALFVVPR